jgi:hypothetical protein
MAGLVAIIFQLLVLLQPILCKWVPIELCVFTCLTPSGPWHSFFQPPIFPIAMLATA